MTRGASLLVTLNTDGLPAELAGGRTLRVGGVGGGQEPGESIVECARREAYEELSVPVRIRSSEITYVHSLDSGRYQRITCHDDPAPLLLQWKTNPAPYQPFRQGLPAGPETYFGLYLADAAPDDMQPGDDVVGLLFVPLECWSGFTEVQPLQWVIERGGVLIEKGGSHLEGRNLLWAASDESFRTVAVLLGKHTELLVSEAP
ncbi:MAG: NUDIX domain-containing protein [Chloroflexi bacterium]|nr:NUDIX domain-containing protein [Chloroflexota bacterium]